MLKKISQYFVLQMPIYKIPTRYFDGFKKLHLLNDEEFKKLIELLQSIDTPVGKLNLEKLIIQNFPNIDLDNIGHTIFSLGDLLVNSDNEIRDIAKSLTDSFVTDYKIELGESDKEKFSNRIEQVFFASNFLKKSYKAKILVEENINLYISSHVISDIRIIFNEELQKKDRDAVIIHKLKIEFQNNFEMNEVFFSMNETDIIELKAQLERALEKHNIIRNDYFDKLNFVDVS